MIRQKWKDKTNILTRVKVEVLAYDDKKYDEFSKKDYGIKAMKPVSDYKYFIDGYTGKEKNFS